MAHTITEVLSAYNALVKSDIFRLDGPKIDLPAALTTLAVAVAKDPREGHELASIGEFDECGGLWNLLIGGYWCMASWVNGMWSPEYAALCAIGGIYTPGCGECEPEPETGERDAFDAFNTHMKER